LPKGNDDIMPNEGDPLTRAQIDLIRDWINQGATWPDVVAAATPAARSGPALPTDFKPRPAEQKAIAPLAHQGVEGRPMSMNGAVRGVNFRPKGTKITDASFAPVKDTATLVRINLGATRLTDAGLANLKGLTNLMQLHLELTPVTDAGLVNVRSLPSLTYLN